MKKLMNLFKRKEEFEVLKEGDYGSYAFRKAVQKAYMSDQFTVYIVKDMVVFEQGAKRIVKVPVDIVEDIIGTELQISRRAA